MSLRTLSISAPHLRERIPGPHVLNSSEPASLFNACRYAASLAETDVGAWGDSNWAGHGRGRRSTFLLMQSLVGDLPTFENLISVIRPNLLLIGAMSLCLPGAVACAKRAKEMLGDTVCTVLGGWHASESIYLSHGSQIAHHPGSPVRLMAEDVIDPVFDLVISGEAERLLAWLGEQICQLEGTHVPVSRLASYMDTATHVGGRWIAAWADGGQIFSQRSKGLAVHREQLPPLSQLFGVGAKFPVFRGRLTSHVFSDSGSGCAYDCHFCSERNSVTGPLVSLNGSAGRLLNHFLSVVRVVEEDSPSHKASAFVEDSTLLAGSKRELERLISVLGKAGLDLRFGAQFTVDQILTRIDLLRDLKQVGLDYLFIGIETPSPGMVGGLSKDICRSKGAWLERTETVLATLASLGIECGAGLLFGLGETHAARVAFLQLLARLQRTYGRPCPVSLNWAVQHPLRGNDGGTAYRYNEWAFEGEAWLDAFRDFGEASAFYPIAGRKPPVLAEVQDVARLCRELLVPTQSPSFSD
jgi:B12-binding domain/radical SAM domain protein